jgi:endonuclease/exonuclease/phosphatase family metal-dependent hydrolase
VTTHALTRSLAGGIAVLAAGACVLTSPIAASAHSSMPSAPTGLRVTKVSSSSFTVSASGSAHHFRLYAATTRPELAVTKIKHAVRSHRGHSPTLTLSGLKYSTQPYYYRIEAMNGSRRRFSAIEGTVTLQPKTPTNLQAFAGSSGTSLSWDSGPATGFTIRQATDAAMTQNVKTYTTLNQDHTFTPYGLDQATTYYFTVAAMNGATASDPTGVVSVMCQSDEQPVKVMTYNIKASKLDGMSEGGTTVAPWSERRTGVANYINSAAPDVVGIQEAATLVDGKTRQVDDLVSALGGSYALANTEVAPTEPGHGERTGVYILYNPSVYSPVGTGGHWELGDTRWAAYQIFENKVTGARFMFVAPHLAVIGRDGGTDQGRLDEDKSMVSQANAYALANGSPPIIYAGDFNSDPAKQHAFNGPSDYNLSLGMADSFDVAQSRTNAEYNSANGYFAAPPAYGYRLDYIFVPQGVAVDHWGLLLNLSHGKFVGTIPSDHNAMVANLLVPYEATS